MRLEELSVHDRGRQVRLTWADGVVQEIAATELRLRGRDAGSVRDEVDGRPRAVPSSDLAVTDVRLIGRYAVNIHFSDGFDRAIYPWSYLRQLIEDGTSAPDGN